jgi:Protein of unknown function (DUF4239)
MRRWLVTLVKLTPVIASASMISILGLIAFRAVMPTETLASVSSEMGNYLQTLGGIYAVLLAFVVYVVWGQFNDVRTYIDREASAIVDLHRTASNLPPRTRAAIQHGLSVYVDAVLRDEWQAMTCRDEVAIERVGEKLDDVWLAVHSCEPDGDGQHTIYAEVITQFNQLMDLRTVRLSAARAKVPRIMNILLYTGAVLVTGSIYLMHIPAFWLHATITAALAGAIGHVLYLIHDLDEAFSGEGVVSKEPFERARLSCVRLSHLVAEHDAPKPASLASDG